MSHGRAAVRDLLDRHGLAPHKDRGQNFLHDASLAERLADSARVARDETVLEIGTGLGILTRALAARAKRVITVEVDAGLVRTLHAEALLPEGVTLRHADALDLDLGEVLAGQAPARVVANLPYAVATPLLRRLLDQGARLRGWSVLVQREVARRITARKGARDYGSFAVLHALCTTARTGLDLRPGCFYPVPSVVSTFLHLEPRADAPGPEELATIERVLRAGFAHRRKTLVNSLRDAGLPHAADALRAHGVPERARAQELAPEVWRSLAPAVLGAAQGSTP